MFCTQCGTKTLAGASYCQVCGGRLLVATPESEKAEAVDFNYGGTSETRDKGAARKKRSAFRDQFKIDTRESCEKAIRIGAWLAFIGAGVGFAFGLASFYVRPTNVARLDYFLDPAVIADAVLCMALGLFVWRKSRVASSLLLVYFVFSKLVMWSETGTTGSGVIISALFFAYYLNAARATYIWHKRFKTDENSPGR